MKLPKVIIGAQWGDEGKGKIVDYLAQEADIVVRFNGGNNAGHTVVVGGERYPLSQLPSGVLWKRKLLIAQGCVINPKVILEEIERFNKKDDINLIIDQRINIVMPYHQWLDEVTEEAKGEKKVGSLKLGIGYCYEDRNNRHGIRLEDLADKKIFKEKLKEEYDAKIKRLLGVFGYKTKRSWEEIYKEYTVYGRKLIKYMGDVSLIVSQNLGKKSILFEGAHGTFLDANFGTYPYTTAVNTISGSVFSYTGFPPQNMEVVGVVKAYTTRVGGGPFPTELNDSNGNYLQEKGQEFGTVSKRRRRCGWLDLPMLRLSNRLNGFSYLAITKLDILSGLLEIKVADSYNIKSKKIYEMPSQLNIIADAKPEYKVFSGWDNDISNCKKFQDLPKNCRIYLQYLEKKLNVPIKYISVGSERVALIIK